MVETFPSFPGLFGWWLSFRMLQLACLSKSIVVKHRISNCFKIEALCLFSVIAAKIVAKATVLF
jgi:hypothetical protein